MPVCQVHCGSCGAQEAATLGDTDFAMLIGTGAVQRECRTCGERGAWKLVPPARREGPAPEQPKLRRVLVIDDELATLRLLQRMLEKDGHVVETASSPDEAISKLQVSDFDTVISDVMMPELDGRTLYRFLTALLPDYSSRVIFVTSDRSASTRRFFQEYRRPYLYKPIDRRQLTARLREL